MSRQTFFISGSFKEETFNSALAEALRGRRQYWRSHENAVTSELTQVLLGESARRPDILVQPRRGNPIIIEVEIDSDPYGDARRRIGKKTMSGKTVYSTIALRAPSIVRDWITHAQAVDMLSRSRHGVDAGFKLEFAVVQQGAAGEIERWPSKDFLSGDVDDLADLCETAATPHHMIETFAGRVASEIIAYADGLRSEIHHDVARAIADAIGQPGIDQGLRLACCIWMSTLRLHDLLAATDELKTRGLKSIGEIRANSITGNNLPIADVRDAWNTILEYNYRSIFGPALKALVPSIPEVNGSGLFDDLARLATQVESEGLGDHVDFAGELFPKLLEDRKETAANYTLPTSATLLAQLAVDRIPIVDWANHSAVSNIKLADFACGTGTLLRAAYRRLRRRYEAAGGECVAGLHEAMMESSITGTDISPLAAHMTAAGLSTIEIDQMYKETNIGALPVRGGKTGALEFLSEQQVSDLMSETVEQSAQEGIGASIAAYDDSYDLVIQNPPYTRPRGGRKMFAVAGISEVERKRSVNRLTALRNAVKRSGVNITSGQAGMGADFSALAHLKTRDSGVFATVLPLTAAHAETWSGFRAHFTREYSAPTAITFATDESAMMSSDTAINEMLLICGGQSQHIFENGGGTTPVVHQPHSPAGLNRRCTSYRVGDPARRGFWAKRWCATHSQH